MGIKITMVAIKTATLKVFREGGRKKVKLLKLSQNLSI
jgi:hypothetical protein